MTQSNFTTENPSLQYAWDNSSLEPFKICPRRYYYNMILQKAKSADAPALTFGSLYHSALEEFDKAYAAGKSFEDAQRDAVRWALQATGHHEEGFACLDPECQQYDPWMPGTIADYKGETPICESCSEPLTPAKRWVPWTTDDTKRTRFTLVRSVVWYTEQFHPSTDILQTLTLPDGKPAIEVSFQIALPISTPFGQEYLWCGHMDKIAQLPDAGIFVQERKHTGAALSSYYFDRYSPNGQVSGYAFAAEVLMKEPPKGVIIDATQIAVNFTRFQRGIAHRTKGQIREWLDATLYHIRKAEDCAKHNNWPMNDSVCGLYGGCPYRDVCNKDPSVREDYLESNYKTRVWNPLEVRE